MLFLADIKTVFINSSCSSAPPHSPPYIKHTEQASGVVQLMPEGPLRHFQLCLFNNAKKNFVPPKAPSPTSDRLGRRSPVTVTAPITAAAEDGGDDAGRSTSAS